MTLGREMRMDLGAWPEIWCWGQNVGVNMVDYRKLTFTAMSFHCRVAAMTRNSGFKGR